MYKGQVVKKMNEKLSQGHIIRFLITTQRIWNFDQWWEATETEYDHNDHLEQLL